jgi:para-nitrobenzyl esterase
MILNENIPMLADDAPAVSRTVPKHPWLRRVLIVGGISLGALLLLCGGTIVFLIQGARLATAGPKVDADVAPPRVKIESGELEGVALQGGIHCFKGIPYAVPPIGELRWRAPHPVAKWHGVRSATEYGSIAPQKNRWASNQSEDCLYLNVWAPAKAPVNERYPVMVWIHGGAFVSGSGQIPCENFAKRDIVLVSFNYRLGRLGSFAHPALDATRPEGEPAANFWLQDQVAALEWVQRNIAQFGGDPNRVTIFGVSAGGASVNQLMASPLSKGLFHRAIAQSGVGGFGPLRRRDEDHAGRKPLTTVGQQFAKQQGISGDDLDAADKLRKLPWQTVATIGKGREEDEGFEPVVDGISLLDDTQAIFEQGRQHPVPFIAGFNSFEGNLALVFPWTDEPPRDEVEKRIDILAPMYRRKPDDKAVWDDLYGDVYFGASTLLLVREMEQVKAPAWTYYFDYVRSRGAKSRGAGHGSEVTYVFDSVIFPGANERKIINTMQGHWIQFAKTGDPNGPGLIQWPNYTTATPATMVYGQSDIRAENGWKQKRFDLLFEAIDATWPKESGMSKAVEATQPVTNIDTKR